MQSGTGNCRDGPGASGLQRRMCSQSSQRTDIYPHLGLHSFEPSINDETFATQETLRLENISEPKLYLYTSHGTNFWLYK
jgi:hypothetical protein